MHPFPHVAGHVMEPVRASSLFKTIHGRDQGDLVNVIQPEHRHVRGGRVRAPGKYPTVGPPRGLFPFRFGGQPFAKRPTKLIRFVPRDVQGRPPRHHVIREHMDVDQMPDQMAQFERNGQPLPVQKCQVLGHAHLITIKRKGVQPDPSLRELRVVILRLQPERIVIFTHGPHEEPSRGNLHHRRWLR